VDSIKHQIKIVGVMVYCYICFNFFSLQIDSDVTSMWHFSFGRTMNFVKYTHKHVPFRGCINQVGDSCI
jgi:hypothetical protein